VDLFQRYWLEEAEKIYPHNKTLSKLRNKISRAADGLEDNQVCSCIPQCSGNRNINFSLRLPQFRQKTHFIFRRCLYSEEKANAISSPVFNFF